MQDGKEERRLDVARVIDRVHRRALTLNVFASLDANRDAAQEHADPDAHERDAVQQRLAAEEQRDEHEGGTDKEDVERDGDVGGG